MGSFYSICLGRMQIFSPSGTTLMAHLIGNSHLPLTMKWQLSKLPTMWPPRSNRIPECHLIHLNLNKTNVISQYLGPSFKDKTYISKWNHIFPLIIEWGLWTVLNQAENFCHFPSRLTNWKSQLFWESWAMKVSINSRGWVDQFQKLDFTGNPIKYL